jgi:hypothetical protein
MPGNEAAPITQVHAVVLTDAEALLLVRPDDVARNVTQQTPLVELALPGFHQIVVRRAIQAKGEQTQQRLFGKQEYSARREDPIHFEEKALQIHELAQDLERQHQPQRAIFERQVDRIAGQADRRARHAPTIHQADAVSQGVGRYIQREPVRSKIVRQQITGMPRVRADFEERRHLADELPMFADDRRAALVFLSINLGRALRFPQRGEIVKLDFGALHRKRLRVTHLNFSLERSIHSPSSII